MSKQYSIGLDTIVKEHDLTVTYRGADYDRVRIHTWDVSRPALPLAGFYDYFDAERVQVIGKLEITYISEMSPERRWNSVEQFIGSGIRFVIVAHGMPVPDEMMRSAANHGVTVLTTEQSTSDFMAQLIFSLNSLLAPRTTLHGVLMEIHGEGVLITGESGVGKSENAMALLSRGHRLVADDAIEVRRVGRGSLIGTAPELIRYFNVLYLMGRQVNVRTRTLRSEYDIPREKLMEQYPIYFRIFGVEEDRSILFLKDYLARHAENGMLQEESHIHFAWLWWTV